VGDGNSASGGTFSRSPLQLGLRFWAELSTGARGEFDWRWPQDRYGIERLRENRRCS